MVAYPPVILHLPDETASTPPKKGDVDVAHTARATECVGGGGFIQNNNTLPVDPISDNYTPALVATAPVYALAKPQVGGSIRMHTDKHALSVGDPEGRVEICEAVLNTTVRPTIRQPFPQQDRSPRYTPHQENHMHRFSYMHNFYQKQLRLPHQKG